jgi:hypothetical protein
MDEFVETSEVKNKDLKNLLYYYLDKHPEDHEKVYDVIQGYKLKEKMETLLESYSPPVENMTDGCTLCMKSWEDTPNAVKTVMLCGHTYHTACVLLYQYDNRDGCPDETCDIDSWRIVRQLYNGRARAGDKVKDTIIEQLQKRDDFKADFRNLKKSISEVRSARVLVTKNVNNQRKQFLHRNIHAIREIQKDMTETYSGLSKSESYKDMRSSVLKYRKVASSIFRKYHVSFRDLYSAKLIRADWRLRHILERHGSPFSRWKFNLRLRPGQKPMDDPII